MAEGFALLTIAAVASFLLATGNRALAFCLFATAVSVRTAVVDYSAVGEVANVCVIVFGIPTLILAVVCALQ